MRRAGWAGLALVLLVAGGARCGRSQGTRDGEVAIRDRFAKDWLVEGNDTLVYSRSFNRRREFGYVSCDNRDKICRVNVVRADAADYRERSCAMRYDLIAGKTGDIALYLPDEEDADSEQVVQAWWLTAEAGSDTRITALHLRSCMNAGFEVTPVSGHPSRSRLVPYRYPSFDLVYSDAASHERRVLFVSLGDRKYRSSWRLGVAPEHMYEERGVELDSRRGFFYLSTEAEPDWTVRIMFADSSAGQLRKLGLIEGLKDTTRSYPKTSGAHRKYGLCWKHLDREDLRVNCTQFKTDGRRSINETSLLWPAAIDWLAVHNLEQAAMLVVAGKCDDGKCAQFSLAKIDAAGRARFVARINGLGAECPSAPFHLSMDIVEDLDRKFICFNFVCLSARYRESSAEKANTTVRYRRQCIDKDFVISSTSLASSADTDV